MSQRLQVSPSPLPPHVRARGPVRCWGRSWPAANRTERALYLLGALGCAVVLGIALWLTPDKRGIGTHEELGLPPCGFAVTLHMPCPSCGFTTTFTLAAHGHLLAAAENQPFGFLVFLGALAAVPLLGVGGLKGISWLDATEDWPWIRIGLTTFALWLAAWGYKIWLMRS